MMIGRSDERGNPRRATAAQGRTIVVVSFAEPIWASGHRAASTDAMRAGGKRFRLSVVSKARRVLVMTQAPVPHSTAPDYDRTLVLAIELSNKSWVLAAQVPGLPRVKAKRTYDIAPETDHEVELQ